MWKQKIGFSVGNSYQMPASDVVKMLAKIGFDAISPEWKTDAELEAVAAAAKECGLVMQSLHAPFGKAADMWIGDEAAAEAAKRELLDALEACRRYAIPVMVVHTWIGFDYTFGDPAQGFANYGEIVARAKEYGVKIAFENTEGEEFLFALMEHFKDDKTVGFCWDSGHEMCYNHSQDLLAKLGDRLIMTHLNDNLGISRFDGVTFWTDDLHLLPGDGIADWDWNVERMRRARPQEILNFELTTVSKPGRRENDIYAQMPFELYLTEVYKRACKIAYKYSK